MPLCPKCGKEIGDGDSFCKSCGTRLIGLPDDQAKTESSTEGAVENVVVRRLDGIKNRDEAVVKGLVDERYSKFDDWPPFVRQEAKEALENEFGAFKVLSDYNYQLENFEANVFGDMAVATFTIHYQGQIRNRPFDMNSRVRTVLKKQDSDGKCFMNTSRFPEETRPRPQYMTPRRTMQP